MSDNKEELFEPPKELKTIDEEPEPKEVEEVEEPKKQYNAKGKERKKNADGTYRKVPQKTPEQRAKMLEALARGREKAAKIRAMKGAITQAKKREKNKALEQEYLKTLEKKKEVAEDGSKEELKELKKELAELKKLFKELGSKPPAPPKETKVEKSVSEVVEPVVESVPIKAVQEPTPVVLEEPPQTLPIPPVVRKTSLRAKSIWSQFV